MRILKYVILLIFLGLIAVTVFIATQKGTYEIKRTVYIKSPRSTVYNYLIDYKNWDQWGFWKEELPGAKFSYSPKTSGTGSFYQWLSNNGDNGKISTTLAIENDSIAQSFIIDENPGNYNWKLKDSANGTVVTWYGKGKLRFASKIQSVFSGGIDEVMGSNFEQSLARLDTNLDYEINTFDIAINGKVDRPSVNYLKQTILSKISNHPRNLTIMLNKMRSFFEKNKIATAGKPFVIYHSYDLTTGLTQFSVCMPIRDEIHILEGSDIQFAQLPTTAAIKSTLKGDYSHLQKAWKKTDDYIRKNNFVRKSPVVIEYYIVGTETAKQPSKWVTEVFFPIETPEVRDTTSVKKTLPLRYKAPVATPAPISAPTD